MATEFIDKARISVSAGKGGNGAVAFHREKYIAAGGPDGGDGGNGGDIILQVDDNMSTLMDFRYKRKYTAENGMDGQGSRKFGKSGKPAPLLKMYEMTAEDIALAAKKSISKKNK